MNSNADPYSLSANQVRAIQAENLIHNGIVVCEEIKRKLERGLFTTDDAVRLLDRFIYDAKEWQKG